MTGEGWARLGRRIKAQRGKVGYATAGELARAAGVSRRTVEVIEAGTHTGQPRETTLGRLDVALGWVPGSSASVVEGGQPREAPLSPLLERVVTVWPLLPVEDQARLAELAERLARGE